jgi:hypothetical protein
MTKQEQNTPDPQDVLQIIKELEEIKEQGIAIAKERIAMYEKDIEQVEAKETDKEVILQKKGEFLQAFATTLESPFDKNLSQFKK